MSKRWWLALGMIAIGIASPLAAEEPEERFFSQCPQREARTLHDDRNPWDPHAVLYTITGLTELEVVRIVDWTTDLAIPGRPVRPLWRTIRGIRNGYGRLPQWTIRRRAGEFVDALQVPEISLGDASTAYTAATGGGAKPTSGTVVRVDKLIDWTQRVTGDMNWLAGRVFWRRGGLVTWSWPARGGDGAQWVLLKTFNGISVLVAKTLDMGMTGVEITGQSLVNVGHRAPHARTTAFLIVPKSVYEAYEPWFRSQRRRMVLGDAALFRGATHAQLAHRPVPAQPPVWEQLTQLGGQRVPGEVEGEPVVIVMTHVNVLKRAPKPVHAYVVPANWVLGDDYD